MIEKEQPANDFPARDSSTNFILRRPTSQPETLVISSYDSNMMFFLPQGSILRVVYCGEERLFSNLGNTPINQARWIHYRSPDVKEAMREETKRVLLTLLHLIPGPIGTVINLGEATVGKDLSDQTLDSKQRVARGLKPFLPLAVSLPGEILQLYTDLTRPSALR